MDVFSQALIVAAKWHGKQLRKYTNDPYIVHPIAVAALVRDVLSRSSGFSNIQIAEVSAAAVMHDVLEDTDYTESQMLDDFGPFITQLVLEVTDVSRPSHGNRAARKAIDREHLARASFFGKTIKLADLIDNTSTIVAFDKDFARVYLKEKAALMRVLNGGHPVMYQHAQTWLTTSLSALKMELNSNY